MQLLDLLGPKTVDDLNSASGKTKDAGKEKKTANAKADKVKQDSLPILNGTQNCTLYQHFFNNLMEYVEN